VADEAKPDQLLTPNDVLIQAVPATAAGVSALTADILLVDDDDAVRLTLSAVLEEDGHRVHPAPDLATARSLLDDHVFEVLVVDLRLGKDSGLDILKLARERDPDLVGIIITAYASLESAIEALRGGAFSYLLKPCDLADLRQAISAGLARRRLMESTRLEAQATQDRSARALAQRVARRAVRLQELTAHLSSSLATEQVLDRIVRAAVELLECQTAGVFLSQGENDDFHLAAGQGLDPERAGVLSRARSLAGRAAAARQRIAIADVRRETGIELPVLVGGRQIGSVAVVPIVSHEDVLGVIEVYEPRPHPWRPDELDLLSALASAAAVALDNARLYEAMQQAVSLRDHVLGSVSHDLKNPIAAVAGRLQLVQRRLRRNIEKVDLHELDSEIEHVRQLTLTMSGFLDALVETAQLQAGHEVDLRPSEVDLVSLTAEVATMVQSTAERHQIEIDGPDSLIGRWDQYRLERVILNLLSNAVKYSPEGGPVRVSIMKERDEAVLAVSDRGIGIAPADLGRIFEPFIRGTNVSEIPGSGLGLAGAKRTVELHHGSLTAASRPGEGTTFTLRVPINPPEAT
jgi:signal transduction histidine kinase/ActR/RegA family two-component response regulator